MSFHLVQIDTRKEPIKKVLGCDSCSCKETWDEGVTPIMGKVYGRKLFIFTQSPGRDENRKGKELIGDAGEWLWEELGKVGISRDDCDIQTAVRCITFDDKEKLRLPTNAEVKCCSVYTQKALEKSKAKVYVIFGDIAARQVCGREFKKTRRLFWSEKLKAKVYCLDHPGSFLRGGSRERLRAFRAALQSVAEELKHKSSDPRYAYFEKLDYQWINTERDAKKEAKILKKAARKNIRVVFDSEVDRLSKYDNRAMPLVMGTCAKPGRVRIFCCYHPDGRAKKDSEVQKIVRIVAKLMRDPEITKVFHHGSSDTRDVKELYGATVRGDVYDTEYGEYFRDPGQFSYGLKAIADRRFQSYSGYASVTMPEAASKMDEIPWTMNDKQQKEFIALEKAPIQIQYDWHRKRGTLRYGRISQRQMTIYNGADCDLTKRIELTTSKKISLPLLGVYVQAGQVIADMERNGPMFDFTHYEKLKQLYPPRLEKAKLVLDSYAKKYFKDGKEFNPNSPPQVKEIIYEHLKLKYPFPLERGEKINTQKGTIEVLARKSKFCKNLLLFRKLSKIVSTYLESYAACAHEHDGRMKTRWWMTGTGTGRLSSGGTKDESIETVVNLQNVHGEQYLKDQLVPDADWRKLYTAGVSKLERFLGPLFDKIKKNAGNKEKLEDKRDEKGRVIFEGYLTRARKKFKSSKWKKIVAALILLFGSMRVFLGFDFGQIEVRMAAIVSGDPQLKKDCESGDIHSMVGRVMTGWAIEMIKKDKKTRTLTKNIHFGILYGLNFKGVHKFIHAKDPDATLTMEQAEEYVENYFRRYPKVAKMIQRLRAFVEEHGYVENIWGFRRPLDAAKQNNEDDVDVEGGEKGGAYWGNQAVNSPIQGAAHQLMLMALAALHRKKEEYKRILGTPTMEVHDALYFFVKLKNLVKGISLGKKLLTKEPLNIVASDFPKVKFNMELAVEGKVGFRLGDDVECESDEIHEIFGDMMLETFVCESKLEQELLAA